MRGDVFSSHSLLSISLPVPSCAPRQHSTQQRLWGGAPSRTRSGGSAPYLFDSAPARPSPDAPTPGTAPPPNPRSPTGSASLPRHSRRARGTAGSWEKGHRDKDRWPPELGVREGHASFLEVSGNPKTRPCGVSKMVVERGVGSCWFFLPRSQWTDGKVPHKRGHPQFACKEIVWRWVSPNWTPGWSVGGETQTWKIRWAPLCLCSRTI